jgi:hypothetical protein
MSYEADPNSHPDREQIDRRIVKPCYIKVYIFIYLERAGLQKASRHA